MLGLGCSTWTFWSLLLHVGSLVEHVGSSSPTRIEPSPLALGTWSLSPWTTREITYLAQFLRVFTPCQHTQISLEKMFTAEVCPCQEIEIHKYLHLENRYIIYILAGMCYFAHIISVDCSSYVLGEHVSSGEQIIQTGLYGSKLSIQLIFWQVLQLFNSCPIGFNQELVLSVSY